MYRYFLLFFIFTILLFSDQNKTKIEVYSKSVSGVNEKIFAKDSSIISSDGATIRSDKLRYDKNSSIANVEGNVIIVKDKSIYLTCRTATINLNDDNLSMSPFFLYDTKSDIWIKSKKTDSKNRVYNFDSSILSSCNLEDPEWSIRFSSGNFYNKYDWLNLYNARLYIKSVPILYLPYFGFSTNTKRRTGLLSPQFYISPDEGFYFSQPIFIAPKDNWDIEIDPHIRTDRGYGGYTTFRFVDTKNSNGNIKFGGFKEDGSYADEFNLKNSKHYGYQIKYKNSRLLDLKKDIDNGMYLDYESFNDIDYKNLQFKKSLDIKTKIATSKLNYYLKNNKYYFGLYAKYFTDTEKTTQENSNTIQNIPTIQLHKSTNSILLNNISYSVDYKYKNFYRREGVNAYTNEVFMPFELSSPIFNDYLTVIARENLLLTKISYRNEVDFEDYNDGTITREDYQLGIVIDLSKRYDNFFHSVALQTIYTKPNRSTQKGDLYNITSSDENIKFTSFPVDDKNIKIDLIQHFYSLDKSLVFYHSISQKIKNKDSVNEYEDLENNIVYNLNKNISIGNRFFFNHNSNKINHSISNISYDDSLLHINLTHLYKKLENSKHNPTADYYTLKLKNNFTYYFNAFGKLEYDKIEEYYKKIEIGFEIDKRCISYKLSYSKDIEHSLTNSEVSSITSKKIFFQINFKPAGRQSYTYKEIQKGNK